MQDGNKAISAKWCLVLMVLFSLLQLCPYRLMWQVAGDDLSYLSHAFTIGLDFDLDYSNEPATSKSGNGRAASHPAGPGVMAAPFVACFSLLDRLTGHQVIADHARYSGSWSYFGFLAAAICYYFGGLLLFSRGASRIATMSPEMLFLLLSSSGAGYFAMNRFTMGHAFEFFIMAIIFWSTVGYWSSSPSERRSGWPFLPASASALILALWVRPANLNILALPLLLLFLLDAYSGGADWRRYRHFLLVLVGWALAFSVPFVAFNRHLYDTPYPRFADLYFHKDLLAAVGVDAGGEGFVRTSLERLAVHAADLPKVLVGADFGILYTNPLCVIGIALLFYQIWARFRCSAWCKTMLGLLVLTYCSLPIAIVLIWNGIGGSYGYRYLFSLFPLGFLGVTLFYGRFAERGTDRFLRALLLSLCGVSMLSQVFFGTVPSLEPGPNFGRNVRFGAGGYELVLARELAHPRSWALMLAKKTPGFLVFNLAQLVGAQPSALAGKVGVAEDYQRVVKKMSELQHGTLVFAPGRYLLQGGAAVLLIFFLSLWYLRPFFPRRAESPNL